MRKQKHYLIYQITNLVNGKIYIGKHETHNIEDRYFGSGKYLNQAKEKYGLENFEFKILIDLNSQEEMNLLEKMVVTKEFCDRDDTYNLNVGGDGGWELVNNTGDYKIGSEKRKQSAIKASKYAIQKFKDLGFTNAYSYHLSLISDDDYVNECQRISDRVSKWHQQNPYQFAGEKNPMFNHVYTQESLDKMSFSKQGKKNNRYGSKWYYDPLTLESHSFLPNEEIPNGWIKGRKIKKK